MKNASRVMSLAVFAALAIAAAPQEGGGVIAGARKGVVTICAPAAGYQGTEPLPFFQEETGANGVVGSGIVLSRDGLILTANHIVAGAEDLSAVLWDSSEFAAKVVAADADMDVAILKVANADLEPLVWRLDKPADVGETVFAIGTPAVFSSSPTPSICQGIVSSVHRTIPTNDEDRLLPYMIDLIESDAQTVPGESGGALVDSQGRLLGMCMAVYSPTEAGRGRTFARPADEWFQAGLKVLAKTGRMPVGTLGLRVTPTSPERAARLGIRRKRLLEVSDVTRGGPCDKAGLKSGDLIVSIDEAPLGLVADLKRLELRASPGATMKLTVFRPGPNQTLQLTVVAAAPPRALRGDAWQFRWRGMTLRDISREVRMEGLTRGVQGVIVSDVAPGGASYKAGLRSGSIIQEVNNRPVRSLHDFEEAVRDLPATETARVTTTEGHGHVQGETGEQ